MTGTDERPVSTVEPPLPEAAYRLVNPFFEALLRSPLHFLVSNRLLLITFTGRRSGEEFTTPVAYDRDGETLAITSTTDSDWWRNLRGGQPVTVHLRSERSRNSPRTLRRSPSTFVGISNGTAPRTPASSACGSRTVIRRRSTSYGRRRKTSSSSASTWTVAGRGPDGTIQSSPGGRFRVERTDRARNHGPRNGTVTVATEPKKEPRR